MQAKRAYLANPDFPPVEIVRLRVGTPTRCFCFQIQFQGRILYEFQAFSWWTWQNHDRRAGDCYRLCHEIERITNDLHIEYFNKADRDCQLATMVDRMNESDHRTFQIYDFLMYPWRDGAPDARLLLIDCFKDELFFLTPNVVVTRHIPEEVNKAIVMLMHLFHTLTIADFQKIAVPMHCNVEGYLYALLTGRVSRELDPLCHIDELEMAVLYRGRHNDLVQELFRLHHLLMKIYADGKLF